MGVWGPVPASTGDPRSLPAWARLVPAELLGYVSGTLTNVSVGPIVGIAGPFARRGLAALDFDGEQGRAREGVQKVVEGGIGEYARCDGPVPHGIAFGVMNYAPARGA